MARIQQIDDRLRRWAQGVTVGDGSGYPAMSVLHPSWQPPSPGVAPSMKVSAGSDVKATHAAIMKLSERLQATLIVHYVLRWPMAEQAAVLECAERTVHERVERAHVELLALLGMRQRAGGFCNMQ